MSALNNVIARRNRRRQQRGGTPRQEQAEHRNVVRYTMYSRMSPVAQRLRTWLQYQETITMNTTVGTGYGAYDYNLNSLFDPNRTGTGHQPRGYDQLAALYQRYRVFRVRYHVMIAPEAVDTASYFLATMCSNGGTPGSYNDLVEQPYSKSVPYSSYRPGVIRGSVDLAKLNGKTPEAYMADDTTQALTSASPAELLVYHIGFVNNNGAAVAQTFSVFLWFDCEFSDPNQLGQS